MRRKETDRIRLQRIVGFSTHPTRSDAPDFTWAVTKIQLIIKDVLKSSFVVTDALQTVRTLYQFTFWVIKVNVDEMRDVRSSKNLETDNRGYRKEND